MHVHLHRVLDQYPVCFKQMSQNDYKMNLWLEGACFTVETIPVLLELAEAWYVHALVGSSACTVIRKG